METFSRFYSELYGDRWPDLARALREPPGHVAITDRLTQPYYLDPASLAVAQLLPLTGTRFLDLCAAPGGKALLIASSMDAGASLTANERSASRRARLHRVLDEHLPPSVRSRITVTGHDARRWGLHQKNAYHGVLADVPCSSERHLLRNRGEAAHWNPRRSRSLASDQTAILAAAIDACISGGWILYSTCTLSPYENDAVVSRVLRRHPAVTAPAETLVAGVSEVSGVSGASTGDSALRAEPFLTAEPTSQGIVILPDRSAGAGPMYAALLQKR